MNNKTLAKTYVRYMNNWFFVSTINRESSAALAPGLFYAETIVWEFDPETRKRGDMIYQTEDPRDFIKSHLKIVSELFDKGTIEKE